MVINHRKLAMHTSSFNFEILSLKKYLHFDHTSYLRKFSFNIQNMLKRMNSLEQEKKKKIIIKGK